jgi:hypothetical protein
MSGLSSNLTPLVRVFNTPVPGNFEVIDGTLQVASLLPMNFVSISTAGLEHSRLLQLERRNVAFSAAADSVHEFVITSFDVNGQVSINRVSYTSPTTGFSDAAVAAAFVAQVTELIAQGRIVNGAVSGASTPVTVSGYGIRVDAAQGTTVTVANTTYAPNATPANAIVDSLASATTAADRITGTTTVTIETNGAHGLMPGDVVDLTLAGGSVGTLFFDLRPGANQTGSATVTNVIVATVPAADTFTLQQVQAGGGTYNGANNDRTLTIRTKNVVRVVTAAAHGLVVGNAVDVSAIATFTVNGGASFSSIVRSVPTTTSLVLYGQGNNSAANANTGTIVIRETGQGSTGTGLSYSNILLSPANGLLSSGAYLLARGSDPIVDANLYTAINIEFGNRIPDGTGVRRSASNSVVILLNEGAAGYADSVKKISELLANYVPGTTLANPASL